MLITLDGEITLPLDVGNTIVLGSQVDSGKGEDRPISEQVLSEQVLG